MTEPIRKLAAIVFTDIVGFTKLTAEDQSKASVLLKQQRELFRPIVGSYKGMWVKEMGDGLLLTFDTTINSISYRIKSKEKTVPHFFDPHTFITTNNRTKKFTLLFE
jgi:hypothetical protein